MERLSVVNFTLQKVPGSDISWDFFTGSNFYNNITDAKWSVEDGHAYVCQTDRFSVGTE